MLLRCALISCCLALLAACAGQPDEATRAWPVLLPLDQILVAPGVARTPDPGLLARGAALRARAAALGKL